MALDSKVYRALEDVVGPENISQEPAILDSYAFQMGTKTIATRLWMPRPEVVLLPGSVEEVQAIVKMCNRYQVKFKAFSTGYVTACQCCPSGGNPLGPTPDEPYPRVEREGYVRCSGALC